ncbi:Serine/threonine-protein kinase [Actinidia chinensis var. chinensis]|uniref:non-specific serine/threonine protein kinase n=1 Tax=Actinidia chinensis var. chinensis TaxID=1590841 RepID=A0A2R6PTY0_ACTCC|nr:Serine/threonine-protein kinase [Actinidia chinensis var. chinensis]
MKNLLKKLHIMPNQSDDSEGSTSSKGNRLSDGSSPERFSHSRSHHNSDHKPFSLSGWFNSVTNRKSPSPPSSSNVTRGERIEQSDSVSTSELDAALEAARHDSSSCNSKDPDIEEYQIQLALELSAKEDPEAVQIEAVKQISLGSCPPENTPAEVVAYRYWNYNALGYDDKILDGFYDVYGVLTESTSSRMPSLVDLQGAPVSDNISWEAILVNRAADSNLLKLEQEALEMAVKSRSESLNVVVVGDLIRKLATLVSNYMGGPVGDPDNMLRAWKRLSHSLKATLGSMVLPLGSLTIGLARHRALLFKVLADSVGIPCRLVKGQQYTGSGDAAMNFVKFDDGREYIVDLVADPGTLIPSDAAESRIEYEESFSSTSPFSREVDSSHVASSSSGVGSSYEEHSESGTLERRYQSRNLTAVGNESDDTGEYLPSENLKPIKGEEACKMSDDYGTPCNVKKEPVREIPIRPNQPSLHARSPSWTEGVSSPAVRRMKVKDVSKYMIDAAKENPHLAQKLHDVLLESGVVAPPNLFREIYSEQLNVSMVEAKSPTEYNAQNKKSDESQTTKGRDVHNLPRFLPPLPYHGVHSKGSPHGQPEHMLDSKQVTGQPVSSQSEVTPPIYVKNVPVAAAAAAAAAVVASSMVVAVAKTSADSSLELPVAAAATATAAAVVATTAAVGKQCENLVTCAQYPSGEAVLINPREGTRSDGDADAAVHESRDSGDQKQDSFGANPEGERVSDRSTGNDSTKSDTTLDDAMDCEILWEDITLGERIGLGSYGEVYRGDLHGTEVAVKKFLDQDLSGQSLEEFMSEVRIMKRLRHPNVVLFMGAVTHVPNLSIVTEFLPRGSLYRLIHRPNNQLDKRRRLRMALDAARGMNYLHNCTPVIVHRDLKTPNLLVDKNWIVKVCDFGLSRMKYSTFLSSRSTAGTAEWMAPEVLRNEPSDEKCDVFSFGVILWELCTLQQPWGGMNPMQVVGAVGFQHRRLDIPNDMDPAIADIIRQCWQTDPKLRPSFAEIMAALKPLQKPITTAQVPRPSGPISSSRRDTHHAP